MLFFFNLLSEHYVCLIRYFGHLFSRYMLFLIIRNHGVKTVLFAGTFNMISTATPLILKTDHCHKIMGSKHVVSFKVLLFQLLVVAGCAVAPSVQELLFIHLTSVQL